MEAKDFIILLLSITTITFAVLFWIYYSSVEQYMKDKETVIVNKERELNKREEMISSCETYLDQINKYKKLLEDIKTMIIDSLR